MPPCPRLNNLPAPAMCNRQFGPDEHFFDWKLITRDRTELLFAQPSSVIEWQQEYNFSVQVVDTWWVVVHATPHSP